MNIIWKVAICGYIFVIGRSSRAKKKWRERDECVRANFEQYNLSSQYIDILVSDASKHSLWSIDGMFDAIVTDRKWKDEL